MPYLSRLSVANHTTGINTTRIAVVGSGTVVFPGMDHKGATQKRVLAAKCEQRILYVQIPNFVFSDPNVRYPPNRFAIGPLDTAWIEIIACSIATICSSRFGNAKLMDMNRVDAGS
mmetsp:Transcript_29439/g.47542  ORF Transcript_29439/g.47542 Transcript_29439/m.47542 type:complete len:116 (-) Transcript_29439:560-907(-)